MSTRAHIGILNKDGTVREIYHHYDGHLDFLGAMLVKHYNTADRVNKLLDLGDMSVIGEEPVGYWNDDLGAVDETKCRTYKERGESGYAARVHESVEEFLNDQFYQEDFTYLFYDGIWFYREWNDHNLKVVPMPTV